MMVICNGNKNCDNICLDGTICSHSIPHQHDKIDCYFNVDDDCKCTETAYQIYMRKDKLKKLNENKTNII